MPIVENRQDLLCQRELALNMCLSERNLRLKTFSRNLSFKYSKYGTKEMQHVSINNLLSIIKLISLQIFNLYGPHTYIINFTHWIKNVQIFYMAMIIMHLPFEAPWLDRRDGPSNRILENLHRIQRECGNVNGRAGQCCPIVKVDHNQPLHLRKCNKNERYIERASLQMLTKVISFTTSLSE